MYRPITANTYDHHPFLYETFSASLVFKILCKIFLLKNLSWTYSETRDDHFRHVAPFSVSAIRPLYSVPAIVVLQSWRINVASVANKLVRSETVEVVVTDLFFLDDPANAISSLSLGKDPVIHRKKYSDSSFSVNRWFCQICQNCIREKNSAKKLTSDRNWTLDPMLLTSCLSCLTTVLDPISWMTETLMILM